MWYFILLVNPFIKLESKRFHLIIDQQKERQWFSIIQSEEKISFHFITIKRVSSDQFEFSHLKCVLDVYIEDILRKNIKIDWLKEFQAGISTENLFIANPNFSFNFYAHYLIDYDSFLLEFLRENEEKVLEIKLIDVSDDSKHWELLEENIPELEGYVFSAFKTLLVPNNRKGELFLYYFNIQNILVYLYYQFEVYPTALENRIRIIKRYFQVFEQTKSEKGSTLKVLHQDELIYEEINILKDKIVLNIVKGDFVLITEVETGPLGFFADFSEISARTTYYLNGLKIEQNISFSGEFFQNSFNPNVRLRSIHRLDIVLHSNYKNRHRNFVTLFIPSYFFSTGKEVEYYVRFLFLVKWKKSDQTALTVALQHGEVVIITDLGQEEKQNLELTVYRLGLRLKIPFTVKKMNTCFEAQFFVDDTEFKPIVKRKKPTPFGSSFDKIVHGFHLKNSFMFGYLHDSKKFDLKKLLSIYDLNERNLETDFFQRPDIKVVPLLTTKYNRLKRNAQRIRNHVKTFNYSTAIIGAVLQKSLSAYDSNLERIISFLEKTDIKEFYDYYQTLLAFKIENLKESDFRHFQINKLKRLKSKFTELKLAKEELTGLKNFIFKKEITFWRSTSKKLQDHVAILNTFFNELEHLMEETIFDSKS